MASWARVTFRVLGALGAFWVLGVAAPAQAQSRRYPAEPADKDAEQAARSTLWSAAISPEHHPYRDLVQVAEEMLRRRTDDHTLEAIKKLDAAIRLLPREPRAYRLRGDAYLALRSWAKCAADFAAADAYTQRDDRPPKEMAELHLRLGLCQARAGKLGDAEKTFTETAASGNAAGELWLRLGEVRIAMGKLDEAIAALTSALGTPDSPQAMTHFLLAAAYDRARRPADALHEASEGAKLDKQFGMLHNPSVPPIDASELDYMLGLAYGVDGVDGVDTPLPEFALAHFRRFVKGAPDSPWRKRAEEHIRDLKASELPSRIKPLGNAPPDGATALATARRAMPQMRACLARFPAVVVEVVVSRSGPRTPATDRMRPRFLSPPDGVAVSRVVGELADRELDAVDDCLSSLASRLAFPAVKERDAFYRLKFYVVGP